MIKKITLFILFLAIAAYFFMCWGLSNRILVIHSDDFEAQKNTLKTEWILPYEGIISEMSEPVTFQIIGADDVEINGRYFENVDSVDCAVILVHGFGNGKTAVLKYADLLWDCGCDVLTYDHRGHGESENAYATGGIKEKEDLVIVTEWLKEKSGLQDDQVAWFGISWGAATVLLAGTYENEMAFIAADSPFQNWYSAIFERALRDYGNGVKFLAPTVMAFVNRRAGINYKDASPLNAASDITEPVFLIHSQTDPSTASLQSENICKHLNAKSTFIHTDWGADHGKDINERPEEYRKLLYEFIREKVKEFGICTLN